MISVAVIDYGMGNLRSVAKALEHARADANVVVTAEREKILRADRVVFPGQGAIGDAMAQIQQSGLQEVLPRVLADKPFLGICLGLQALLQHSEEDGGTDGLAILPGRVRRFPSDLKDPAADAKLKIPHMGWNEVHQVTHHPLWRGIAQDSRFYFVHSYYVETEEQSVVAGTTDYGVRFVSAAARDNLFAVQFHPEKSQRAGLTLLSNFLHWDGQQ